jgi:hypothetical protein
MKIRCHKGSQPARSSRKQARSRVIARGGTEAFVAEAASNQCPICSLSHRTPFSTLFTASHSSVLLVKGTKSRQKIAIAADFPKGR